MNYDLLIAFLNTGFSDGGLRRRPMPSEDWAVLFGFYNRNKPAGEKALGMSCTPCYDKVYAFCKLFLQRQAVVGKSNELLAQKQKLEETSNEFRSQNIV